MSSNLGIGKLRFVFVFDTRVVFFEFDISNLKVIVYLYVAIFPIYIIDKLSN